MEAIFPKTALKIAIWVFFGGLKSKSGYFLGFSKKISDEHTYHFNIKSPPGIWLTNCIGHICPNIWLISISIQQDLFDRNNTKDKAEETTQSLDGWGRTKEPLRYSKSFTCKVTGRWVLTFYMHLYRKITSLVITVRYCCSIIWISLTSLKLHSLVFSRGGGGGGGGREV